VKIFEKCSDYLLASSASANKAVKYFFLVLLAEVLEANKTIYYLFGIKFETIKFIKFILMKKLRFVSIIIVLLLFCPFIKQCDGMRKTAEKPISADSTAVVIDSISEVKIKNEPLIEIESIQPNQLKIYFIEDSENVFEIAYENGKSIIEIFKGEKSIINDKGFFTIFSFCLFSILLIFTSLLTSIYSFLKNYNKIRLVTILNITFILSIVIVFYFSGLLERFGQLKIGFYLLLLSNFYMLYLLKQKKEQIL
jgi:hypothetical protein